MKIFYSSGGLNEVRCNVDVGKKGKQVCLLESSARTGNLFYQLLLSVASYFTNIAFSSSVWFICN